MTTSDIRSSGGTSAQPRKITADQRLLLRDVTSAVAPWLSPGQAVRAAAQALSRALGVSVAFVSRTGGRWDVLGESREDSSTLGIRINDGPGFDEAVALLEQQAVTAWRVGPREYTLLSLPLPPPSGHVVLMLEGDWMQSAPELLDCVTAFVASHDGVAPDRPSAGTLERLVRRLASASSIEDASGELLQAVITAVPCRYASVAVAGDDGMLGIVAAHGYPVAIVKHLRIESGSGIVGSVFARAQPLLVRNIDALESPPHSRIRFRTKCCAAVPVAAGAQVLAVLSVADRQGDGPFSQDDVERLSTLAAPTALALARLRTEHHARELAQAATVDSASGLFNRLYFQSRLQEELQRAARQGTPLALQLIDVDSFKGVNDQFGHLAGDAVIKDVADIVRQSVRVFDVCARYGGDEFVVVMPGSRLESAAAIAERIRTKIEERPPGVSIEPPVTVSIGVVELRDGETPRDVIGRADQALYAAKRAGKNRVVAATPPA